ncbi:MAG: ABC transporter ATP-binding protein [Bacillota bacterium]|mgnify:CR=1 FL=1|nr:ABC transporter ATP-binding protein [Bacillota bacterium]
MAGSLGLCGQQPYTDFELSLEQVSHSFGKRRVLTSVSAAVRAGQVMVVTGPNGSGKSTLIKIAARLIRPASGRVVWRAGGRELGMDAAKGVVGLVSPELTLYDELTAIENLLFFARVRGWSGHGLVRWRGLAGAEDVAAGGGARARARAILEQVGLEGRGDDLVGTYSSGMKQRLKYAFALMHSPALLLLDEPTANLDEAGTEIVRRIIAEARGSACVVVATNEPEEVTWGDAVIRLGGVA